MTGSEIVQNAKITHVWTLLGGTHENGRGMAFYRNGDNKTTVALDDAKGTWYDHRDCIGGGVIDLIQHVLQCGRGAAIEWLAEQVGADLDATRGQEKRSRITAEYNYTDELGNLLYQVVRYDPKGFKQRRPDDGEGGWRWGLGDVRRVLYHLPELIEAPIVFIAEGERDCEALRDHGFVATCNSGGAGKWRPEFNQFFAGKEVCILPDADPPGWKHALDIARGIVGIAAKVQMLELPGAKDAAEWFACGHSELELIELVEAPCAQ